MPVNTFNLSLIHQKMCDEQLKYFYRLIDQNEEMSLYVHEELGLDC